LRSALLLSGALVPALFAACGPDWNALDPSQGGAATTTTTTGTGGQTTQTTTTTTTQTCSTPFQCPGMDSTCATRTCTGGVCGVSYASAGKQCGGSGNRHCDGMGNCI
jgi:hypothetical protein